MDKKSKLISGWLKDDIDRASKRVQEWQIEKYEPTIDANSQSSDVPNDDSGQMNC